MGVPEGARKAGVGRRGSPLPVRLDWLPLCFLFPSVLSHTHSPAPGVPVVAVNSSFQFSRIHATSLIVLLQRHKPQLAGAPSSDGCPHLSELRDFSSSQPVPRRQRSIPAQQDSTSKSLNFNHSSLFPLFLQPCGW